MSSFEASGSVTFSISNLDQIGDDLEAEAQRSIGSVTIGTDGGSGGGRNNRQRRRARQLLRNTETQTNELSQQTELLEGIHEELEDGAGGGGGGGGGGLGLGGLGLGAAAARGLPGLGALGGLGTAGAAGIGAGLGLGGVRLMQELGITEDIRGIGEDLGGGLGGSLLEAAGLSGGITDLGAASLDLAQGDLSFSNLRKIQAQRLDVVGDVVSIPKIPGGGDGVPKEGGGEFARNALRTKMVLNASTPGEERQAAEEVTEATDLFHNTTSRTTATATAPGRERQLAIKRRNRIESRASAPGRERQLQQQDTTVNAPISINVNASAPGLEREIDRKIEQAKREIMNEVNAAVPNEMQNNFQGRIL